MLTPQQHHRYQRQVLLPRLGAEGQARLLAAKVLVVGAGGLGCPVLQYLTAAGIGVIGIIDDDVVNLTNLHRQVLYTTADIGKNKVEVAVKKLEAANPDVRLIAYPLRLTNQIAFSILEEYDLVVDGSDNFATRYLVNDVCTALAKPLVFGSIYRFEGQVAVFNHQTTTNYRHLFAEQPGEAEIPNCAEAGVLGVLPGIIGSLMANEVIKIITGIGQVLAGKLLTYTTLYNSFYEVDIPAVANGQPPMNRAAIEAYDYGDTCSATSLVSELSGEAFTHMLHQPNTVVADVREHGEHPQVAAFAHIQLPLSQANNWPAAFTGDTIIVFCQSGTRSRQAAQMLADQHPNKKVYTLKGGILQWMNNQQING